MSERSSAYRVRADWDPEAGVWVAGSDDVMGLVAEAATIEALIAKLRVLIPELLELNGQLAPGSPEAPFEVVARYEDTLRLSA
jgi:hypothetical protein